MDWRDFLNEYRKQCLFDPAEWVRLKCILFDKYLETHGISGVVVSVSGGIDSAVTLLLMKKTMELPNSHLKRIVALNQPIHSSQWALDRATELCDKFGIPLTIIDQSQIHNDLTTIFEKTMRTFGYEIPKFDMSGADITATYMNGKNISGRDISGNSFSKGQLRSYLRTPANYYAAQLLKEQGFPAIVMGTGNLDEDGYLAYFCKYGDGAVDVQLISDLHKYQVLQVGVVLNVPESILTAAPSADLWDGQTDEDEMGFPYEFVEYYVGYHSKACLPEQMAILNKLSEESRAEFLKFETLCTSIHKRNAHKLKGVVNIDCVFEANLPSVEEPSIKPLSLEEPISMDL